MLSFLNEILINLSFVVSVILGLYFISINLSLTKKIPHYSKQTTTFANNFQTLPFLSELILGVFIGFISFLISYNKIYFFDINYLDVRYFPIFFTVFYGTPRIGTISTFVLIVTKAAHHAYLDATFKVSLSSVLLPLILLGIVLYLYKKQTSIKKAARLFLFWMIVVRSLAYYMIYTSYVISNWETYDYLTAFISFSIIYSLLFWLTFKMIMYVISTTERVLSNQASAVFDYLTGLYNKKTFHYVLNKTYHSSLVTGKPFAVAMIDLDDFKLINDTFGHLAGDKALQQLAQVMMNNMKELDCSLFRLGGDEFSIIFNNLLPTPFDTLTHLIQELDSQLPAFSKQKKALTLSIGLTYFYSDSQETARQEMTIEDIITISDKTLYEAKQSGKNNIKKTNHSLYL